MIKITWTCANCDSVEHPDVDWCAICRPMMTDEEYVQTGGNKCPYCKSVNVESSSGGADGSYAWADCSCADCPASWTDVYELTGFNPDFE